MLKEIKQELFAQELHYHRKLLDYALYSVMKQSEGGERDNPLPYESAYALLVTPSFKREFDAYLQEVIETGLFDRYFEASYYANAPVERIPEMTQQLTDMLSRPFGLEWARTHQAEIESLVTELYTASAIVGGEMAGMMDPESFSFDLVDRRAVDQLNRIGTFWISEGAQKHIVTDSVTRLAKIAIERGYGLEEAGRMFKAELSSVAAGKSDLYYRNLASSVMNRTRNVARILQFNRLQITEVKILGVPDARQCSICQHMDGQVVRTSELMPAVERLIDATTPEEVIAAHPYVNSIDMETEEFVLATGNRLPMNSSSSALAEAGIMPEYHPGCRCTAIVNTYYA